MSQCSVVPYKPISVINVQELEQQSYSESFAWFPCLILVTATLGISAVHCIYVIQPWISEKTGKYYTKIINRSKVKIFQSSKVEGKGSIYSTVKGSAAAYMKQGLSLKINLKDFFPPLFLTFKGIRFQSFSIKGNAQF